MILCLLLISRLPVRIGLYTKKQITAMVLNEEILSIIEDNSPNWTAGCVVQVNWITLNGEIYTIVYKL